jgi:hypothetical protein
LYESEKLEIRRILLRVLQKDFHALSLAQFEHWSQQMLSRLDHLNREVGLLTARVAELEQQLAQRDAPDGRGVQAPAPASGAGVNALTSDAPPD